MSGLGVRYEDASGTLDWFPDGRLEVDVGALALGTARVEGTVTLTTVLDPGFDLAIRFDDFQALDRRDATGRLSGDLRLEGSFSRPVMSGDLFWMGEPCFTRSSRGQPRWPICSSSVPPGWRPTGGRHDGFRFPPDHRR